jgi:hypothetical protein
MKNPPTKHVLASILKMADVLQDAPQTAHPDLQDPQGLQDQKDLEDRKGMLDHKDHEDAKDFKVLKDLKEILVIEAPREKQEQPVRQG